MRCVWRPPRQSECPAGRSRPRPTPPARLTPDSRGCPARRPRPALPSATRFSTATGQSSPQRRWRNAGMVHGGRSRPPLTPTGGALSAKVGSTACRACRRPTALLLDLMTATTWGRPAAPRWRSSGMVSGGRSRPSPPPSDRRSRPAPASAPCRRVSSTACRARRQRPAPPSDPSSIVLAGARRWWSGGTVSAGRSRRPPRPPV